MSKCVGCGIKLQTVSQDKPGFVPLNVLNQADSLFYCKRCYQIIHNGLKYKPNISDHDYYQKIKVIGREKCIVVLMLDILDPFSGFIPNLKDYIGDNPLIIALNKVDFLPKSFKTNIIEDKIYEYATSVGLKCRKVVLISSKKGSINSLLSRIELIKKDTLKKTYNKVYLHNTYLVGCASVGKSTFINSLKEKYLTDKTKLTTSRLYQTTLDFIKVPVSLDDFIIDTPGLVNKHNVCAYLGSDSLDILEPSPYIRPKTYQLRDGQTLFLGGLVRLDFSSNDSFSVSIYTGNKLYCHRTKTENASKAYESLKDTLLVPPFDNTEKEALVQNLTTSFNGNQYDLYFSGIGFIHITGENVTTKVSINEHIFVKMI